MAKSSIKVTKEMVEKISTGDPISDDELDALIWHLRTLLMGLELMGPEYGLARRDVRRKLSTLEGYWHARRER